MTTIWRSLMILVLVLAAAVPLLGQEQAATETAAETAAGAVTTTSGVTASAAEETDPERQWDSGEVQRELDQVLRRHPEDVGTVLKLDPSLFRNEQWMATYPVLREFVAKHPEVAQNPSYYLQNVSTARELTPAEREAQIASQMIETIAIGLTMVLITGALIWLIRTVLEHRRWSRMTRTQTEIQNKLLDRFTTHEELLRYVQSGAGKDLLQSAVPAPLPMLAMSANASPYSRVLWPAQVGVVLFALGVGLAFVAIPLKGDAAAAILALGVIVLFAGIGAVASALVGWQLSRKLGALPDSSETAAIETRTLTE